MAGLCWMAVVLAFSLSVGNTEAMDQNKVQKLAKYILNNCFLGEGQVSLAVNFPANLDQNSLHKISEECALIKDKIGQQDGLYKGTIMVAAKHKTIQSKSRQPYTEHAEERVLDNMQHLAANSAGKSLIFYSFLSPCTKCTTQGGRHNILDKIKDKIDKKGWNDIAFVFSKVYTRTKNYKGDVPLFEDTIKTTLENLGTTIFDDNIFHCYSPKRSPFKCIKCLSNASPRHVDENCLKNEDDLYSSVGRVGAHI